MNPESKIFKAQELFNQIIDHLYQAAADKETIGGMERSLWPWLLQLGRLLLQAFVEMIGTGDLGETLEIEGQNLKRLDQCHEKRYVSVFGEIQISRTIYGSREKQKHEVVPLDAHLNLPAGDFSYLLQEWDQSFCVQSSFSQAKSSVQQILGIGQSVRSLEHMSRSIKNCVRN